MTTISSLPEEVLEEIFRFIESNVQPAQCRLVCSKWRHPADSAMFSNTIVLKTKEKAMTLYAQLFSNPSKGESIRHLYIDKSFDSFWMLKTIFGIDAMPNLESFEGEFSSEAFYDTFLDVIKDAPTKFNKLKALPLYQGTVTQEYCDALCACSSTLAEIRIDNEEMYLNDTMKAFAFKLESFGNLETSVMGGNFGKFLRLSYFCKDAFTWKISHWVP
ncbi:hypothetical protein FB192DRAFT_1362940 [Mucor lusitanicus]|uniref:F-box domain-containing protein n=2 Tax=Mucor circinelloides f. lusitanicus TaxID=29924 RepID=A0A162THL1_MUCCL|nr:hypothetical protein FB192DRAFT_1362940 [Mucor lusitanicus]OAD04642.1 hypothetical protein MUCCIDRAFT_108471 [Mucor lusitanicus CBS 277.49]